MFKEAKGNMWEHEGANAFVVTTNGFVKKNGKAVMGRGCAREASKIWPSFPLWLGTQVKNHGNHVYYFYGLPWGHNKQKAIDVFTFPVKHNWWERADIDLIEQSAKELVQDVEFWNQSQYFPLDVIVMPRPGCGNGGLSWKKVKPVIAKYLDERFVVYDYGR